jgi:hypothetical protein
MEYNIPMKTIQTHQNTAHELPLAQKVDFGNKAINPNSHMGMVTRLHTISRRSAALSELCIHHDKYFTTNPQHKPTIFKL